MVTRIQELINSVMKYGPEGQIESVLQDAFEAGYYLAGGDPPYEDYIHDKVDEWLDEEV